MSKHDLQARPIFHRTREAIEAHLSIVFPRSRSPAVSKTKLAWPSPTSSTTTALRTSTITINGVTENFPPKIPAAQREIIAHLGIETAY